MKILHIPTDVGGNPTHISQGLSALGVDSKVFVWTKSKYDYAVDMEVHSNQGVNRFLREFLRIKAILFTVKNCDIVHFNFGKSWASPYILSGHVSMTKRFATALLNHIYLIPLQIMEFKVYKRAGLKMFVHFQGDDIRQGDVFLPLASDALKSGLPTGYYQAYGDYLKRQQIKRFAKYCKKLYYVNPDLKRVLPKDAEFVPYALSFPKLDTSSNVGRSEKIIILHSPTNEKIKGTQFVRDVAEALSREFPEKYQFKILSDKTNQEILKEITESDLVIDQLLFGWYGGFAAESMARGVPVICFIRSEDKALAPKEISQNLPILEASTMSLKSAIETFVAMTIEEKASISLDSYKFAKKHHDKLRIAEKLLLDYEAALSD